MTTRGTAKTLSARRIHPADVAGAARRVAQWCAVDACLGSSYPQVFHSLGRGQTFGLYASEQLVCHAATHAVRIGTPEGQVDAVLIGSVATAPEMRNQGLASELLRQLLEQARVEGKDAALLWSDRWAFYERLGFLPSGRQTDVTLRARCDTFVAGIRPAQAGDLPQILALHRNKPVGVDRDLHDLALLLSIKPMTTMVLERDGEVEGYACCGKGIDFSEWWHEFGGDDELVAQLIHGAMILLGQRQTTLLLPPYRERLRDRLQRITLAEHPGISALRCALTPRGETEMFVDGLDSI